MAREHSTNINQFSMGTDFEITRSLLDYPSLRVHFYGTEAALTSDAADLTADDSEPDEVRHVRSRQLGS